MSSADDQALRNTTEYFLQVAGRSDAWMRTNASELAGEALQAVQLLSAAGPAADLRDRHARCLHKNSG